MGDAFSRVCRGGAQEKTSEFDILYPAVPQMETKLVQEIRQLEQQHAQYRRQREQEKANSSGFEALMGLALSGVEQGNHAVRMAQMQELPENSYRSRRKA